MFVFLSRIYKPRKSDPGSFTGDAFAAALASSSSADNPANDSDDQPWPPFTPKMLLNIVIRRFIMTK